MAFLMALSLSWLVMVPMLFELPLPRLGFVRGGIVLLVGGIFFLGFEWGWLWPFFSMSLAVGLTIVGMGAWKLWQSRLTVHQEIVTHAT
jgi:hypothetical protein